MAHTCPECGMLCYCGGDIDDCEFDGTTEQARCGHCDQEENTCATCGETLRVVEMVPVGYPPGEPKDRKKVAICRCCHPGDVLDYAPGAPAIF